MPWTAADVPDLRGRTFVVTGANSGLGLAATRAFAARGARVIMACRRVDAARAVAAGIAGDTLVEALDLADLESVRAFAERLQESSIDVLVNNAGVMALPYCQTCDGFEMQLGTNHFGHFALTGLLLPKLRERPGSRVVTVSSLMHKVGRIDFSDLDGKSRYSKWSAYGQSKLANLLFAYELGRRLEGATVTTISVAAHPGYAATNLQTAGPKMTGNRVMERLSELGNGLFAQSAAMGALPEVYAAVAPEVSGGDFIGPGGLAQAWGHPKKVRSNAASHDRATAARLWDISVERTGVDFGGI